MIFKTIDDIYYNLAHFHKFFVVPSDGNTGYLIIGELPPKDINAIPENEGLGDAETKEEADKILGEIMRRMAMEETCYSMAKILEQLNMNHDEEEF
jgi:hypothetical protein